jgi:hypothetical protein
MTTTKDRALEALSVNPDFQALSVADQDRYVNGMIGTRNNILVHFGNDPDFQALSEPDRYKFLRGLAPEYFDIGEMISSASTDSSIGPAMEPKRVDSWGQTIAEGVMALNELTPLKLFERASGAPKDEEIAERERRATELMGAGISKVIGSTGRQVAGVGQLLHEANPFQVSKRVAEYFGAQKDPDAQVIEAYMQSSFAALRNAATKEFEAADPVLDKLGVFGRATADVAIAVAQSVPAIAAMLTTGSFIPALATGLMAYGESYGTARAAKYSPLEAGVIAAPTAGLTAGAMALNAKMALDISKPLFQRVVMNTAVDAMAGFSIPMATFAVNQVVDNFYKTYQDDLTTPGMDFKQAFKSSVYNMFINAASGQFLTLAPEVMRSARLYVNGLKATRTPSGETVIHPVEYTAAVEDMLARNESAPGNAQKAVDDLVLLHQKAASFHQRKLDLEQLQDRISLDELAGDPQVGPIRQANRLSVGQKVGVSPKYFIDRDNKPRNMEAPAKIVKNTYTVDTPIQGILPGGVAPITTTRRDYVVDVKLDSGEVITGLPRKWVVTPAREGGAAPMENLKLVDFTHNLLYPDIPVSDMTAEQARLATGGILGIVEKIGQRGNLERIKGTQGAAVWDLARNNPEHAARVFSHGIGHFLDLIDSTTLKELNIPEFEGFKEWFEIRMSKDPANQPTFTDFNAYLDNMTKTERDRAIASSGSIDQAMSDWWLSRTYGDELSTLWDRWALYPSKKPNGKELMANALSVFLNEAAGGSGVPGLQGMQIYQDFITWSDSKPNLRSAMALLRDDARFTGSMATNQLLNGYFHTANKIEAEADRRSHATGKTFMEAAQDNFQNKFGVAYRQSKDNPLVIERIERSLMTGARSDRYLQDSFVESLKQFREAGINPDDYRNRTFANRILKNRTKTVETLLPDSPLLDYDQYNQIAEIMRRDIREEAVDNHPEWSGEQLDRHVDSLMQEYVNDNIFKQAVDLQNPMGFTRESAQKVFDEQGAKYSPAQIALMDNRMKLEHQAFTEWLLPIIEQSGQYTSRQIALMRDNVDYAKFNIVHHLLKDKRSGASKPGTERFFREQEGTLAMTADTWAGTIETHIKMALSAEKAGMTRDVMQMIAELEQVKQDNKAVYVGDTAPDNTYEVVPTRKYNPATGKMEQTKYVVKKQLIEPFLSVAATGPFLNFGAAVHGKMKGYMTIYNPKFWFRNFARDVIRTAINMPGVSALWEIPGMAVEELVKDEAFAARGRRNPMRTKLLKKGIAGESISSHQTHEIGLSTRERLDLKAGNVGEPKTLAGTYRAIADQISLPTEPLDKSWAIMKELGDYASYKIFEKVNPLKNLVAKHGESVEFSTKAAAFRYLKKKYPTMSEADRNWWIRNAAGTPMLNKKGNFAPYMNNLLMFYNPNMQGLVGDYGAFKRDPYSNVLKRLTVVAPYLMFTSLALTGKMGEDMREWAENIPRRQWSRGINIPLGFAAEGDSAMLQLPVDPLTSLMLSMGHETVSSHKEGRIGIGSTLSNFMNDGSENLPSVTPMITTPMGLAEIMETGNTTEFSGRQAIDPSVQKSDETLRKGAYTVLYTLNQGWGGPLNTFGLTNLMRWGLDRKYPKPQTQGDERSRGMSFWQMMKTTSQLPLSNAIGGLIKFGAGGVGEIIADRASSGQRAFETQRNKVHQTLQGILAGNTNLTDDELILLSDPQFSNTIKKTLTKELIMQTIMDSRPELGKIMEQYFYNPDRFERAEIIKMILERQ